MRTAQRTLGWTGPLILGSGLALFPGHAQAQSMTYGGVPQIVLYRSFQPYSYEPYQQNAPRYTYIPAYYFAPGYTVPGHYEDIAPNILRSPNQLGLPPAHVPGFLTAAGYIDVEHRGFPNWYATAPYQRNFDPRDPHTRKSIWGQSVRFTHRSSARAANPIRAFPEAPSPRLGLRGPA